jgi:hypothetical protein
MRIIWALITVVFLVSGCESGFRKVEGNGVIQNREKSLSSFDELEVSGAFKIKIVPSNDFKALIEADENLQEYVQIEQSGSRLKIKMRNNVNFKSSKGIKITVYGNEIDRVELAGSSSLQSDGQLENDEHFHLTIAGSADADLDVKTPETKVSIGGSGKVKLEGKTRDLKVNIAGSGDFIGNELMSENTDISIAGSGSAKVYTSIDLKISIAGSGDVFYAGNPKNIKKSIAGSGNIKPLE